MESLLCAFAVAAISNAAAMISTCLFMLCYFLICPNKISMKTLALLFSLTLIFVLSLYIGIDISVNQFADTDSLAQAPNSVNRQARWLLFSIIGLIAAFVVSKVMKRKKRKGSINTD